MVQKRRFEIFGIPTVEWGERKERVFVAVHGYMSNKEDTVIQILAETAAEKGIQVLSFDLPQHGDRKERDALCKVENCVADLRTVIQYAKQKWQSIGVFACSMGAYFSLMAYEDENLTQDLFVSPVVDMERIIRNMMRTFSITPERLQEEQVIEVATGQKMYWDDYCYVNEHPIRTWNVPTAILYGAEDDLCEREKTVGFCNQFHCQLEIVQQSGHYFHTPGQLSAYTTWLRKNII